MELTDYRIRRRKIEEMKEARDSQEGKRKKGKKKQSETWRGTKLANGNNSKFTSTHEKLKDTQDFSAKKNVVVNENTQAAMYLL